MTVASAEPVDLEAQRAELVAVLRSPHFAHAPKLAHLLAYLCKRLFAGEADKIKEYTVAVELFNRRSSFDQDSDSIVRVEANRLRKRLADYYASDGASHRLRIGIPVGRYVPEFKYEDPRQSDGPPARDNKLVAIESGIAKAATQPAGKPHRNLDRMALWLGMGLALLLLGLGCASLSLRYKHPLHALTRSERLVVRPEEPQVGPPMGEEVRILAGASRSFVDHAGKLWVADNWFDGGNADRSSVRNIWRTQDPAFYRDSRQGQFRYRIPLKKGIYELRLHFAETVYGPESTGTGGEGSRIFSVRANGKTLLSRFDILTDAGAGCTADVKVFTDLAPDADGYLYLEFSGEDGKQAILSAIEILPGVRGHIRPVRLLARQTPYYSNDSHWWSPDNYFVGGQLASYASPVTGTDDPGLFETERWGNFSYAVPVAPGRYSVTLYFAARRGDWDQSSPSSPDGKTAFAHIFNVFCNGKEILKDFNLAKEARQTDIVTRRVTDLEPNAQGKLLLSFVPVDGYATVTGIEVLPQ